MKVETSWMGLSALSKGAPKVPSPLHHEGTLWENTRAVNQEEGLLPNGTMLTPCSWTSQPLEPYERNVFYLQATTSVVLCLSSPNVLRAVVSWMSTEEKVSLRKQWLTYEMRLTDWNIKTLRKGSWIQQCLGHWCPWQWFFGGLVEMKFWQTGVK